MAEHTRRWNGLDSRERREERCVLPAGRGFTLIEVMIVIALVLALTVLVLPVSTGLLERAQAQDAVERIQAAVHMARGMALREGNPVTLVFMEESGGLSIAALIERSDDSLTNEAPTPGFIRHLTELPGSIRIAHRVQAGIDADEASDHVEAPPAFDDFDPEETLVNPLAPADAGTGRTAFALALPDGQIAALGTIRFAGLDAGDEPAAVLISRYTGRISIQHRPRRNRSGARRRRPMTRRGSLLLEIVLALAIFVVGAGFILSALGQAASTAATADRRARATDLARSAIAKIEAGIASAESLIGPVTLESDEGEFADSPPVQSPWTLEIETSPSEFGDLMLVRVTARHRDGQFSTLYQLVRNPGGGFSRDDFDASPERQSRGKGPGARGTTVGGGAS